ncbi:MAG: UDP-N-acetylmuramate--L-alanine ligase, partial [Chlorobi bacterium]|nr:UDP-N-acetylmuramate--L-alanine ligase [Chlorobiota bacterium]
ANIPGNLNDENVDAATAIAVLHKINFNEIKDALKTWQGVKRRFEYVVNQKDVVYIDDYAHHPEELKSFLTSVKNIYKDKHITGVFQPHLFTRTRDFAEDFAKSLDLLDTLYLLDIYPAREEAIEGVSSELILNKMKINDKEIVSKDEVLQRIKEKEIEVLVTVGAGDIDRLVKSIEEILKNKSE